MSINRDFGFSYDINEDQQYVVFGGYARSYDRNLYSTLSLETTKIALNNNPQIYFPYLRRLRSLWRLRHRCGH